MKLLAAWAIGLSFGLGIAVSGMMNPAKVLNFFDPAGTWDPSLLFVMGGALAVAAPGYRLAFRRGRPLIGPEFRLPAARRIDAALILGSAAFGAGWGIAGFCPGGALPALGTGLWQVWLFVAAMVAGQQLVRLMTAGRIRSVMQTR